ncbi:hypothetical protein [Sapientia aquatica]|uniref:Uncharacterized protein n=1 Tax=Sapientia aquatica TaxID=1549640 RepID=A0A4R5VRW4_9BURK|nr:hypothetical protein [Sapientia aquatica]TDK61216.1 hypothetical protein E2I14_17680 [Sapientia aquatica]
MSETKFLELQMQTLKRKKRKTNLNEYETSINRLMNLDVSLPIILEWLTGERKILTTLPALRRFIRRVFGDEFYDDFMRRNGWYKSKGCSGPSPPASPKKHANSFSNSDTPPGVTQEELKASLRQKVNLNGFKDD